MELNMALEAFRNLQKTMAAYNHAIGVMMVDGTTAAPADSWEGRGRTMEVLTGITYALETDPKHEEMLQVLEAAELDAVTAREVEVFRKQYNRTRKIPAQEYVEYNVLLNDAQAIWEKAKNSNDFALFAPYLERIVAFNRKLAHYYRPDLPVYDALLDEYEEGLNTAMLDKFFEELRKTIVPLLAEISRKPQFDRSFLEQDFPVWQQRHFSEYLMEVLGLPKERCSIGETEHPFTESFNNKDVRITTHYNKNNFIFSMYSVIHEGGHAIYELGAEDCYNETVLSGGVSMGIHESQSRFYENLIGRSRAFIHAVFPEIQRLFPEQMAGVTEEQMYCAVNRVEPSLIRTEADELTYALHIMVRYQIEREMIDGTLPIAEVPARWNELYKEYLGIDVPSDREGCLQDSHWAGGAIGYFPSYALGSAYGAQFLARMEEEIGDIYPEVAQGDLCKPTAWLREHIHKYASFKKPGELLAETCGEFDAGYFTKYLTQKFGELYGVD